MAVGRVVLVGGVLVLLFIPYLLWGTGLMTAHSQSLLRAELRAEQHRAGVTAISPPTGPAVPATPPPAVAPSVPPPPIGSPVGTIDIPKIGLDMVVVEGTDEPRLQLGPGHYPGTPLPGEAGNVAIAGHRTTYLHPFYSLDALVPGDAITITTTQGSFRYDVTGSQVVSPDDVAVVGPTPTPQLTLTTCNPRYSASQRLVVHAALAASVLVRAAPVATPSTTDPGPTGRTRPSAGQAASVAPDDWLAAVLWGVAVAALVTAVWTGAARTRRSARAGVLVVGTVAWLGVVFLFFQALAPLLPASY